MNPSVSRLLVALPLSLVLSTCVVLLTWSVDKFEEPNYLFNAGIIYTMVMFSFMAFISLRKIIFTESHDYKAEQLELMLAASVMTGKPTLVKEQVEELDDIEFDYTGVPAHKVPAPEIDRSLRF